MLTACAASASAHWPPPSAAGPQVRAEGGGSQTVAQAARGRDLALTPACSKVGENGSAGLGSSRPLATLGAMVLWDVGRPDVRGLQGQWQGRERQQQV